MLLPAIQNVDKNDQEGVEPGRLERRLGLGGRSADAPADTVCAVAGDGAVREITGCPMASLHPTVVSGESASSSRPGRYRASDAARPRRRPLGRSARTPRPRRAGNGGGGGCSLGVARGALVRAVQRIDRPRGPLPAGTAAARAADNDAPLVAWGSDHGVLPLARAVVHGPLRAGPGLAGGHCADWLYSARGPAMDGDGIGLDGRHHHVGALGASGWVNAAGHHTCPGRCAGHWSRGQPAWLQGGWRNAAGQVTFPLSRGGWSNGRGRGLLS